MKLKDRLMNPEAGRVYGAMLRRMTPEQKLLLISNLRGRGRALVSANVRQRHPDYTEEQVRADMLRRMC